MGRLLQADFYKLLRRKAFYVCSGVVVLLMIASTTVSVLMYNLYTKEMLDAGFSLAELGFVQKITGVSVLSTAFAGSNWLLILGILLSIFITSDFTNGTIKNVASRGFERYQIYLSKYIMAIFCVFVFMVLQGGTAFICGSLMSGNGVGEFPVNFASGFFTTFGLQFLIGISVAAFFTMIAFIIRKNGGTIAINVCVITFIGVIVNLVDKLIEMMTNNKLFELSKYSVFSLYDKFNGFDVSVYQSLILSGVIVCVCWLVASTAVGIACFQNRDI